MPRLLKALNNNNRDKNHAETVKSTKCGYLITFWVQYITLNNNNRDKNYVETVKALTNRENF